MGMDDYFGAADDDAHEGSSALLAGSTGLRLVEDAASDEPRIDYSDPEAAIEALHREYAPRLLAYAMSMLRNREDAEDAIQTAFMNAYGSLVDGRVPRQETSWMFRIVRNACLNRIRTSQRKPAGSLEGIDVASTRGVEDQAAQHLHATMLRTALERLPEQQRKAIVLRELQGASYAEIATALDTTQGAVESLIFRARRQLATTMRSVAPSADSGNAASAAAA